MLFLKDREKRNVLILILSGISLVISFFFAKKSPVDPAWIAILLCGFPIIKGAVIAFFTKLDIRAGLLVSIALIASVIIGETFAAGEIAFIMMIGEMLEGRTLAKARAGIEKLVNLTPRTAHVIKSAEERIVPAEEVQAGDILRVLAGETIAVDGIITNGHTSVNQSVLTGESLPVDKEVGDEVFSGTVNQFGTFDMTATKVGEDSSLQRMIHLVESADADKAEIVGIADKWAVWIILIALASAVITWLVTGEIIRAVTILVVFCPCALILATPTAIMAGIANAAKYGILVRQGDALERLARVTHITFDKTGTLTYGVPFVVAVDSFDKDISNEELLSLAASAERLSEHPLGKAIVSYYKAKYNVLPQEPSFFKLKAGLGIKAAVSGKQILAGNAKLLSEYFISVPNEIENKANAYKNDGCTVIYVAVDGVIVGIVSLADKLREGTPRAIEDIEEMGINTVLLTGDNENAANHIGKEAMIDEIYSDCLPETKLKIIGNYQNKSKLVAMVGDGINDAPALKKAYVGIAMGGIGSDIAIESSDIVLVGDDIKYIPHTIGLSKNTIKTIKVNIVASLVLNFVAIVLAIDGILNPVLGALIHNLGSIVVVINSMSLLNWKRK